VTEFIGGVNPVLEAVRARGSSFVRIYLARGRGGPAIDQLIALARSAGIKVTRVERQRLDRLYSARSHQGIVAEVGPFPYTSLEQILESVEADPALMLVLDGIQDPMNLGALLRSAEAAGAGGVVLSRDRACPVTATVIKASAGAAEHLPVARVVNLGRAVELIKQRGFWMVGAHPGAERSLFDLNLNMKVGLVLGGEGRGLRRLIREKCDILGSIPLRGRTASLNASAAGAVAMFEFVRQTRKTLSSPEERLSADVL
jgi:23S rRNA (guanosine2251-2'-O)-methyltransferase